MPQTKSVCAATRSQSDSEIWVIINVPPPDPPELGGKITATNLDHDPSVMAITFEQSAASET